MRYSRDFREKVMGFKEQHGLSVREAADRFGIHFNSVQRWSQRLTAKPCGRRLGLGIKLDRAQLAQHVATHPDAYIAERAAHFGVARHTIWHALQQMGVSCKKKLGTPKGKYTK
jgi:transposase